jgi:hypothetical protein
MQTLHILQRGALLELQQPVLVECREAREVAENTHREFFHDGGLNTHCRVR